MPKHTEAERKKKKDRSFFQQMLVDMFTSNKKELNERVIREGQAEKERRKRKK